MNSRYIPVDDVLSALGGDYRLKIGVEEGMPPMIRIYKENGTSGRHRLPTHVLQMYISKGQHVLSFATNGNGLPESVKKLLYSD